MADPFSDYGDFENDVGLGEEDKSNFNRKDEWLKMTKGQVLRAALVYFHTVDVKAVMRAVSAAKAKKETLNRDAMKQIGQKALEDRAVVLSKSLDQLTEIDRLFLDECQFKKLRYHYQPGLGMILSRLGLDGPEGDAVWKRLDEQKHTYTTLLCIYPTDKQGNIPNTEEGKSRVVTDWQCMPWRCSQQVYERFWKLNAGLRENNMGLHTQDIKLECKDDKYQNIDVSFVGQAIWRKNPKFQAMVLAKALTYYDKLVPFREMSTDMLRSKLGMGGSAVSDVSAGAGGATSGDFSELLDSV